MEQTQYLSTDPTAGDPISTPATAATAPSRSVGTWEDRGIAGKVWRPASAASELHREDNSLLGLPPEFAVTGGLGVGRAMAAAGAGLASRAIAGVKATAEHAAPIVKFEIYKHALMSAGLPWYVAEPIALTVSGFKRGGAAATPTAAADTVPAAEATAAEMPLELTRRTKAEYRAGQGHANASPPETTPAEIAPPAPAAAAAPPQATKPARGVGKLLKEFEQAGLTPSEIEQAVRWIKSGADPQLVLRRIQDARALQKNPAFAKLPTNADVNAAVADRNTKGRWPE